MKEQKAKMRFDAGELTAVKNIFADNEELAKVVRRVFIQSELSVEDATIINTIFKDDSLKALIIKFFNPTISGQEHLHQMVDLWLTVDTKEKTIDQIIPTIRARRILINYISQQIEKLFNLSLNEEIKLSDLLIMDDVSDEAIFINLLARNTIVQHVEQMIGQLLILAGEKQETVEQTQARLQKNSAK